MIEQIGKPLPYEAFFTLLADGTGATGLVDVTVDVRNHAGTEVVTGAAASEIGDGIYGYTLDSALNTGAGLYTAVFKTASALVVNKHLPALWVVGPTWVERLDGAITAIPAAVWNVLTATLTTLNSIGKLLADNLPNLDAQVSGAAVPGDQMTLTDGAITAAKIASDAIDADALKADAVTEIATAVWAYATRTLTSFGTLAADVWAYATRTLTQTAQEIIASVSGDMISQHRGDTWAITLAGLGGMTGYANVWFTIKQTQADKDTNAVLQVDSDTGLLVYAGWGGGAASGATLTVTDEAAGDILLAVKSWVTAALPIGTFAYDVQVLIGSTVETLSGGKFTITADITRAIE